VQRSGPVFTVNVDSRSQTQQHKAGTAGQHFAALLSESFRFSNVWHARLPEVRVSMDMTIFAGATSSAAQLSVKTLTQESLNLMW
jgi:hypothetical protein